ncbi:MAG: patatin-like phospholipase family protein [Oscillospiraceae bacterium]|nr:patatin-like phospholipase family protein [Oscillospiraceae bacterium]
MSFGLALSGGGVRGAAHVGVLLALEENRLFPSSIAGSSAGGMAAGLYASGMTPQDLKELVLELSKMAIHLIDPDYLGLIKAIFEFGSHKCIQFSGLIKGNKLENYLDRRTDHKKIDEVRIRTIIPSVDLYSGKTIAYCNSLEGVSPVNQVAWKTGVRISAAMRASLAVPAVFQPKMMNQMCLVDGGVTNILPVDLLIAAGEKNVLAVDVSKGYQMPECNNIIEIASHSLSLMQERLRYYITSGERYLLKPSLPDSAGLLTFQYLIQCMDAGYEAARELMPTILKLMR